MGYIKQITIQGFKSYKDQTKIEPFSAKSNIIVGRNGAGKSNFFAAVRFVLGDDYENMSREERQALLHEGSGSAVMSAYVEVIFDNSDSRFHNNGKSEFVLRRTIGAKKDEYSMDRKNATKREVFEMLEAAGLSRSNPFYIVPQGRVTAITNMKDEERLNLLKEISGSNVYEKRRADSLKLLADTNQKCERIDDLVNDINLRLSELEGEKKELEAWNKNDRERRALLYTMNARREGELEDLIEKIDDQRHGGLADVDSHQTEFIENEREMGQISDRIDELKSENKILTADRVQLEEERKDSARHKAALEMKLDDLKDGQSAAQQSQRQLDTDLKDVQKQIQQREKELSELLPEYVSKKDEEAAALSQLTEAEGQRKRLEEKQGRTASYSSKKQRDDSLRRRVDEIAVDLAKRKSIQMQTDDDMKELQKDISTLDIEVAKLSAELENEGDTSITLAEQVQQAKDAKDALIDQDKILARELRNLEEKQLNIAEGQLSTAEGAFSHLMDRNTSRGLETLRWIREQHNLPGIYGTVAELIEVPESYKITTEVAAGNALFNVICDNDETASKVIDLLNKTKGGRLTCIPLNRIQSRVVDVPQTADALPLLPKLRYDSTYEKAIKQIFGKVIICPDLPVCQSLVRTHDVLALTLDGDRAHKKGGYHGGYFDPSKSKLDAHRKVAALRKQVEELRTRKSEIKTEQATLRQRLTAAAGEIKKAELQKQYAEDGYLPMRQELRMKQAELQRKKNSLEERRQIVANISSAIHELGSQQADLEAEISSDFKKALTREEETLLQNLAGTVRDMKRQVATLSEARTERESRKTELELELGESLNPRLDRLLAQQKSAGGSGGQSMQLKESERLLKNANKVVADFDRQIRELDESMQQTATQLAQLEESRAEKERSNRELAKAMERAQKGIEKKLQARGKYKDELTEVQRDIRELGTLPEEAYHKFLRWSTDKLVSELDKANKALKKYSHVNKKAFQQYEEFTKKREHLNNRRGELNAGHESIQNLIEVLDHRKDEAIARTFKQVSKYFQEVFVQLVPAGQGRLVIQRRSDREARRGAGDESDEDDRANGNKTSVENFTGVGISVSFNSKHDEQQRIQQLSGGQKALCALALVFAIQQCDPAPFYLFDEIDANLDAQYRTAVAEMLRKLSGKGGEGGEGGGQFICTTFRPEMVLVADKCYAVSYKNSASKIDVFDREGALAFVETSQKV